MRTGQRNFTLYSMKTFFSLFIVILMPLLMSATAFAADEVTAVSGQIYEFDKDSHYDFQENGTSQKNSTGNTYGTFCISGNVAAINEKDGIPSYEVANGKLDLYYNYGDSMLNADEDTWHLVNDKSKKVADMKLDSDIMKGAIILQTSKDRKNWISENVICNTFSDIPIQTNPIYSTPDVQLINGCYYRVIVVYKLAVRTENSNFLFINTDKYNYKKCAEVYEFYAYTDSGENNVEDSKQTYSLGSKVKTKNFDGYFGEKAIDKSDIHYGWELGSFFVSGYTDKIAAASEDVVFLKNVGDKVTLWFKLNQNINSLNGKSNLSITSDAAGYDQYFETPKMNFGRGALIIRCTDHNNVKSEPTIYTNYLEANASVGADTKVQLFEEGDYEVALDYEVTSDELIDKTGHYRIFFKFSVRNGNCMVYPFDVKTGSELTNSAMTENGFRLDLAKSRYLKINLKKETLKDSADGLIEDTRFNGPAKDGAEYTDEGIYTITVSNEYTGQSTTKKIYVGTNNVLRAYMKTGLSISEINRLVANGATISDDGTLQPAAEEIYFQESPTTEPTPDAPAGSAVEGEEHVDRQKASHSPTMVLGGILVCVIAAAGIVAVIKRKKQTVTPAAEQQHEEGGAK